MSYRPSSARRQQTSVNPITGKKVYFIKDQTTPMYVNSVKSLYFFSSYLIMKIIICYSIPSLDLSDVTESDRRPPPSAKQYHGSSR
jgi:hypothetical protein